MKIFLHFDHGCRLLRKGVACHLAMMDELLNFEMKDGDRVIWFDVLQTGGSSHHAFDSPDA